MIVYCTHISHSKKLIELLSKSNYQGEIVLVSDDIPHWKNNGFDVVASEEGTVHEAGASGLIPVK